MSAYITAITFSENSSHLVHRTKAFKAEAKKARVKVSQVLWSLGDSDGAIVFEAKDDEAAGSMMRSLAGVGEVHPETLRKIYAPGFSMVVGAK